MRKVAAMISGGLDSLLTIKVMARMGFDVTGLHFFTSFSHKTLEQVEDKFAKVARDLDVKIEVIDVRGEFLEVVKNPHFGYGSNLNPCIDCKIFMFRKAADIIKERGIDFIASGEVLGQRPMSQYKDALQRIEKFSGLAGWIVRPLCGRLLDATIPEQKGWLKREDLLDINGRGRGRQIALAKELGIEEYPWPGGGCLLTEPAFSARLKDLMAHGDWGLADIELLKCGRHFRLDDDCKLVMGRNQQDNVAIINAARPEDFVITPDETPGPSALLHGRVDEETKALSLSLVAGYTISAGGRLELLAGCNGARDKFTADAANREAFKEKLIQ